MKYVLPNKSPLKKVCCLTRVVQVQMLQHTGTVCWSVVLLLLAQTIQLQLSSSVHPNKYTLYLPKPTQPPNSCTVTAANRVGHCSSYPITALFSSISFFSTSKLSFFPDPPATPLPSLPFHQCQTINSTIKVPRKRV